MAKRNRQAIPKKTPVISDKGGARLTVVGDGKPDAAIAIEIRALLASVADRMNEAAKRNLKVDFHIGLAGPSGPFVVEFCRIERVQSI